MRLYLFVYICSIFSVCVFGLWQWLNIDERPFHTPFPWLLGLGGTAAWHCISGRERTALCLCSSAKKPLARRESNTLCVCKSYSSAKQHCSTFGHASNKDTHFFDPGLTNWPSYTPEFNFTTFSLHTSGTAPFIYQPYSLIQFINHSIDHNWAFAQAVYVQLCFFVMLPWPWWDK